MKHYVVEAGYHHEDRQIQGVYSNLEEALDKATQVAKGRALSRESLMTDIVLWEKDLIHATGLSERYIHIGILRESKTRRGAKEIVFEFDSAPVNEFEAVLKDNPTTGDAICVGTDQVEVLQKITDYMKSGKE